MLWNVRRLLDWSGDLISYCFSVSCTICLDCPSLFVHRTQMYPVSTGHYFQLPTSLNFSIFICIYLFQYLAHKITCLAKRHTDVYILHKLTNFNLQMMRKGMVLIFLVTIQMLLFISTSLAWFNHLDLCVLLIFSSQCYEYSIVSTIITINHYLWRNVSVFPFLHSQLHSTSPKPIEIKSINS